VRLIGGETLKNRWKQPPIKRQEEKQGCEVRKRGCDEKIAERGCREKGKIKLRRVGKGKGLMGDDLFKD